MSKQRFALLIAIALCVGASAGAYKPQCKDSSGRLIVCTGTLDNTQAPTAIAASSLTGTVAQANGGLGVDASALSNGVVVKSGGVVSTATAPTMSGANITAGTVPNASLANSSLTVTASTGLSGGGAVSLGGSTSLAVAYGTTSGTATQGNDARLNPTPSGAGRLPYDTGSAYSGLAPGTANTILQSNGAAAPSWTSAPTVSGANITTATLPGSALTASSVATSKITGGTANRIPYDNGTNASWTAAPSSASSFLRGSSPPAFDLVNLNTDTAGVVPTAKGGTNLSSFTAGGVFFASDSSSVSFVGPCTSGYVITSNGTAPTCAAPVTSTASQVVLGVTQFDITSTSYAATGLSILLPSAGTYEVWAEMRQGVQVSASPNGAISTEFYNVTDGAVIANSERLGVVATQNNLAATTTIRMSARITVNGAKTIEVYALRESGPSYTFSYFYSDGKGRTVIGYEKKA